MSNKPTHHHAADAAALRPTPEEISRRAYEIWESEGAVHGRDQDHWRQAEGELTSRLAQARPAAPLGSPGPATALPAGGPDLREDPRHSAAAVLGGRANPPGGRRRF